jgi:hypothetical protein
VSPVKYEMGFYIPEDDILHSHCRENKSYINVSCSAQLGNSAYLYHGSYVTQYRIITLRDDLMICKGSPKRTENAVF